MVINTALITLLMRLKFHDIAPSVIIAEPVPPLRELQARNMNKFSADFDRDWYVDVGVKVLTTMFFNIVTPHLTNFAFLPCSRCYRLRKGKQQTIQRDMNKWIMGPTFDLIYPQALALNTIIVSYMLSSGVPMLLFSCTLTLLLQYWCFKFFLLR